MPNLFDSHRPKVVVGLLGLKRSGKDTFASRLVEAHGFTRVAFADPLKEAALALNPLIGGPYRLAEYVEEYGWEAAKERAEVRRTLQDLGLAIRAIDPDFWIDAAVRRVEAVPGPVVVTDVRFPNEVAWASSQGFTVRIVRPGQVNTDPHPSENSVNDVSVDFTAPNDGTIGDLHQKADQLVRILGIA